MFEPTTDRDVRLSRDELYVIEVALRDEIAKRSRSIKNAEAARAAGRTIQQNTLEEHYRMRDAARSARQSVEVALRQIALRNDSRSAAAS